MTRLGRHQGFRVTARDREIVRWIGRLRMVTAAHVTERFGLGRAVAYARLGGLVKLGLLEHARVFHGMAGVYLTTRAGLHLTGLELPPSRIDVRTYEHDVRLSSLVIQLETEFGHERIVTEREMRASDSPLGTAPVRQPRFAVPLLGARGQLQSTPVGHPRLHFPDCAIAARVDEAPIVAIELERTAKGRARLRGILSAYVAARHIRTVRYYVTTTRVEALVRSEVRRLGADSLVGIDATLLPRAPRSLTAA